MVDPEQVMVGIQRDDCSGHAPRRAVGFSTVAAILVYFSYLLFSTDTQLLKNVFINRYFSPSTKRWL
jgi:hypothetical protein